MPRDINGNVTLPTNDSHPAAPRNVIRSSDFNELMSDLSTMMEDSLSRSGKGGMTADLDMDGNDLTNAPNVDAAIVITQALPAYPSGDKGQAVVVKDDGTGFELSGALTGDFFAEDGARVMRLADRVFMGAAVENLGTDVDNQPDWLTQKLISYGRTFGFQQVSQAAILTTDDIGGADRDIAANAFLAGAKTSSLNLPGAFDGNAIGLLGVAINDSTDASTGAFGGYFEGFKEAGTLGPAYGAEFDIINFDSAVAIDPFTQSDEQTVAQQIASGAEFTGATSASAVANIRNNGANFLRGYVIGNDAIAGTDGTAGRGPWLQIVTGHTEQVFSAAAQMAWERGADPGLNGDYFIESQGTGSLTVKRLKETVGDAWTTFTPTITAVSGTFTSVSATGRYRALGKSIEVSIDITITTNGTAAGGVIATLPFTAASGVRYTMVGSETATTGVLCQGRINASGTSVQIFKYDNTYPGGSGTVINLTGIYQRS